MTFLPWIRQVFSKGGESVESVLIEVDFFALPDEAYGFVAGALYVHANVRDDAARMALVEIKVAAGTLELDARKTLNGPIFSWRCAKVSGKGRPR